MDIRIKTIEDIYVIEISGRMDTINSRNIEPKLDGFLEEFKPKVVIDLSEVDYISSVGLRVLLSALKKQIRNQGILRIASLQPFVREVFTVTQFDKIFPIYSTQEEAIKSTI
jgi:anti-sigma B factor antagonist